MISQEAFTDEMSSASLMTALRLDATWRPRAGYRVTSEEDRSRSSRCASQIWCEPRLVLAQTPIPGIAEDEVLVRVKTCGVCGSDAHCVQADDEGYVEFSGPARFPVTLGHELSGEVVDTGRLVSSLRIGDLVTAESVMWCGLCESCRSGNLNQCERAGLLGFTQDGAFAEFVAIKERFCWRLDPLLDRYSEGEALELGALVEPIGCAYNGMFVDGGGFQPGAYVAVFGAGPIGLSAIMLARAAGAAGIYAFEPSHERRELARKMGADEVFDVCGERPSRVLAEVTRGAGVDLLVEAAGAASETVPEIAASFAANGKMVFLGRHDTVSPVDFNPIVSRGNALIGARGHAGHGTFPRIIRLLAGGRIPAREMITARLGFGEAVWAVKRSVSREEGKILVSFDKDLVCPDIPNLP